MPKKFIELARFNNNDHSTENDWLRHCTEKAIPYITVHLHGNLADVQWDYINFSTQVDAQLFAQAPQIQSKAKAIYEPIANETSWISLGPGVISFKNLSIWDAKNAAEQLFDVISDATVPLVSNHARDT